MSKELFKEATLDHIDLHELKKEELYRTNILIDCRIWDIKPQEWVEIIKECIEIKEKEVNKYK